MTTFQSASSPLLRRTLQLDGAVSLVGAIGFMAIGAVNSLATLLGFSVPALTWTVGAGLVVYALWLFWITRDSAVDTRQAMAVVVINALWVLGSIVVLFMPSFTLFGNVFIALIAIVVGTFGLIEFVAIRKTQAV